MKNTLYLPGTIIVFFLWTAVAFAAGDLKLVFSLQVGKAGGAMASPAALFVDAQAERYYVTDSGHNRLVSFDRNGKLLHAFSAGGALDKPVAMTKKDDGRLLVVEKGKGAITEIDIKSHAVVPHTIDDQGRRLYPQRLKAGRGGFYAIDKASGDIVILDQSLAVTGRLDCPGCQAGYADLCLKDDSVYALPMLGSEIHVFDRAGSLARTITLTPPPSFPISLAVADDGGFFILERHAGTIVRYHGDGRLLGRYLGPGQREGTLYYPVEIQFDPWGRVCIVDEGNGRVGVFQP